MKPGSVLVDIAIDQGGCFEDSRPTTHAEPTFPVHDSVFYCVANMPGAVPNTSTYALTNATLPYIVELANRGWGEALRRDPALAKGLNTHDGQVVYGPVAEAHGLGAPGAEHAARLSHPPSPRPPAKGDTSTRSSTARIRPDLAGKVRPDVCRDRFASTRSTRLERNPSTVSHTRETCRATALTPLTEGCSVADTSGRVRRIVLLRTGDTP